MIYFVLFFLYIFDIFNRITRIIDSISVKDIIIRALIWAETLIGFCWKAVGVEKEVGQPIIIAPVSRGVQERGWEPVNKTYTFTMREDPASAVGDKAEAEPILAIPKKRGRPSKERGKKKDAASSI
jgi:hypothetical protein